jgi:hypothetical protein
MHIHSIHYYFHHNNDDTLSIQEITRKGFIKLVLNNDITWIQRQVALLNSIHKIPKWFANSVILRCILSGVKQDNPRPRHILATIYNMIGSLELIDQVRGIRRSPGKIPKWIYYDTLGFSARFASYNTTISEIMKQVHNNNISLDMTVRRVDNTLVRIIL